MVLLTVYCCCFTAASAVPGCQADAEKFLTDMKVAGLTLCTTAELFQV